MIAAQEKPDYGYSVPVDEAASAACRPAPRAWARSERRARMVLTALILSVFALGTLYVLVNAFTTSVGYRLENLKHQVAAIDAENQTLEMLIGKQDTLVRIEAMAVAELGMVAPTDENTLVVAISDPRAAGPPGDPPAPTTGDAGDDSPGPETGIGDEPDPGLLEALFSLICRQGAGAEPV